MKLTQLDGTGGAVLGRVTAIRCLQMTSFDTCRQTRVRTVEEYYLERKIVARPCNTNQVAVRTCIAIEEGTQNLRVSYILMAAKDSVSSECR